MLSFTGGLKVFVALDLVTECLAEDPRTGALFVCKRLFFRPPLGPVAFTSIWKFPLTEDLRRLSRGFAPGLLPPTRRQLLDLLMSH